MTVVDTLPRRPFFGALFDAGAVVAAVWPDSAADRAGVQVGDRVAAVDGVAVLTAEHVTAVLRQRSAGETADVLVSQNGESRTLALPIVPCPVEHIEGAEIELGAIAVSGIRQRTIVVRPVGIAAPPVVVVLAGLSTDSIDFFPPRESGIAQLISGLAAAGIASIRIEKRGVGDSEGGPAEDVDFETECAIAAAAIDAVRGMARLDAERIVVFGRSSGGMSAPLVAGPHVRGIVAYGTWAGRFTDAMAASIRRQRSHAGDAVVAEEIALMRAVIEDGATPPSDGRLFGRSAAFFRQIQATDFMRAWQGVTVPTLLMHGELDAITSQGDHTAIAAVLAEVGVDVQVRELAGFTHDMLGPDARAVDEVIAFVRRVQVAGPSANSWGTA